MRNAVFAPFVAILLLSSSAAAQEASASRFGKAGSVSIAAERMFGVSHTSASGASSMTTVSLLGSSGLEAGVAPYSIPRLGFDFFLQNGFSVGLAVEFAVVSPENGSSATVLGVNPRVGYVLRPADTVAFWPRAGVSYVRLSGGGTEYTLAATLEMPIVITVVPHFGFLVGPTFDIGLAATNSTLTQLGLQAGIVGWF